MPGTQVALDNYSSQNDVGTQAAGRRPVGGLPVGVELVDDQ